jgi:uncharacterized protein YhfF
MANTAGNRPEQHPASGAALPDDREAMAAFWARCREALPELPTGDPPPARRLGRTAELCERLNGYVITRSKTGVFSQLEDFPGGRLPRAGDLQILANFQGQPRCLVRYEECRVMPFSDVGPEHVAIETPALRDLEAWRRFHRGYWEPVLAARGESFREDQPLVFQRFTCLYPPA